MRWLLICWIAVCPAAALAQPEGFTLGALRIEGGGAPLGSYGLVEGRVHGAWAFGQGQALVDLGLSHYGAQGQDLATASGLFRLQAQPRDWLSYGGYLWLGAQSRGGAAYALGVEAAVQAPTGFGAELFFGETRGGQLGDGYGTNKGLTLFYEGPGTVAGYVDFAKDTANLAGGDSDIYRAGLGLSVLVPRRRRRSVVLSAELGLVHYDRRDKQDRRFSLGLSVPLGDAPAVPVRPLRRGVLHQRPLP